MIFKECFTLHSNGDGYSTSQIEVTALCWLQPEEAPIKGGERECRR